jgi:hypothetical protein
MDSGKKYFIYLSIIIIAIILQLVLIFSEERNTPGKSAVGFAKAYFVLDPSMADYLCNELTQGAEEDVVGRYLQRVADNAKAMGFEFNYMKEALYHIETDTKMEGENKAQVRIIAEERRYVNPLYASIGRWFVLTEAHEVDETLTLVKEDGRWKVCDHPFSLVGSP